MQLEPVLLEFGLNCLQIESGYLIGSEEEIVLVLTTKSDTHLAPADAKRFLGLNLAVEYLSKLLGFRQNIIELLVFPRPTFSCRFLFLGITASRGYLEVVTGLGEAFGIHGC